MSNIKGCFSSNSDEWSTPLDLFFDLDKEFNFTLDPCCSEDNKLCFTHFTKDDDGLSLSWDGFCVFCNPPYSDISRWVQKCFREWMAHNITIVLLIPSRTDTVYFHEFIYPFCELRFIKGRLHFSNSKQSAPFPSMIAIYKPRNYF